jgi:thiol-disulfide isomerase/thioredoxin
MGNSAGFDDLRRRHLATAGLSAVAVLLLTIGHHLYGASLYQTPWRAHIAHHGAFGIIVILAAMVVTWKWPDARVGRGALWVFTIVTALFPVAWIGLFEGGYNHVVKNTLYFGGLSDELMRMLFPPPTYELPNDLLFEITGVLQFFIALVTAQATYQLVRNLVDNRMATRVRAIVAMLAAAAAAAPVSIAGVGTDLYAPAGVQQIHNQVPAPSFALPTLDGRSVASGSLRGKVILVNFWATWCGPCKEEMPALQRLKQNFKSEEFELLAITTDPQREAIKGFVESLGLAFPILLDEAKDVSATFGVRGLPTTVLIGKDGRVLARAVGPRAWASPESVALIRGMVEGKP